MKTVEVLGFKIHPAPNTEGVDFHEMKAFLEEKGWGFQAGGKDRLNIIQLLGFIDEKKVGGIIRKVREKVKTICPGAKVEILRGSDEQICLNV